MASGQLKVFAVIIGTVVLQSLTSSRLARWLGVQQQKPRGVLIIGANRWHALKRIILPLSMPGVIAGALLVFVPSLGAFITPAILGGGKTLMIGNLIQQQFGTARNWPLGSSLSFLLLGILLLSLMLYALYTRSTAKTLRRGATA